MADIFAVLSALRGYQAWTVCTVQVVTKNCSLLRLKCAERILAIVWCVRRYVEDDTVMMMKKLYITDIQSSDEGVYQCRAARLNFRDDVDVTLKLYSKRSCQLMVKLVKQTIS